MLQKLVITYESGDLRHASLVYENMLDLKDKIEELSNKIGVKSISLEFEDDRQGK